MVLMESYLFCASVRLGVLVISAFAMAKSVIVAYIIFVNGIGFMNDIIQVFETTYRTSLVVKDTIYWLEKYPQQVLYFIQFYSCGHIMSCMLAAHGAYRLKGNQVLPLAIFEILYTVQVVVAAIFFLRIIRHYVNLSTLTFLTIIVTFYSFIYDTLALLAFVQIVRLVFSERYQRLYGKDPFHPILRTDMEERNAELKTPQPIIIYVMPQMGRRLWHLPQSKWWQDDSPKKESFKAEDNQLQSSKNFLSKELISDTLLRNALNKGFIQKE